MTKPPARNPGVQETGKREAPGQPSRPPPSTRIDGGFARRIIRWQKSRGRHDLPWQRNRNPYAIWVSEIMLQQTQVATVRPYYERFMKRFPTLERLGRAHPKTVLLHFAGLGYYARARNLHAAARILVREGRGVPSDFESLIALPGIGRSTAGAILALAYGAPYPILDGNVRRLFARFFEGRNPERSPEETMHLWNLAEKLLPRIEVAAYTQGLMDLGATVCRPRNPDCPLCPLERDCAFARTTPPPRTRTHREPVRERLIQLLWIECRGRFYLVERPARGIWGGLHCPPEIADGKDPGAWLEEAFHTRAATFTHLPRIEHSLTHLKLAIESDHAVLTHAPSASREFPGRWISRAQLATTPLPTPIARLLQWSLAHPG